MKKDTKKVEAAKTPEVENVEVVEIVEVESPEALAIREVIEAANNKNEALTALVLGKFVKDFSEADKKWTEFGAAKKNTGFRARFYDALRASDLSEAETLTFAEANKGSKNDIKQISHFSAISDLVRDVRISERAKIEAEAAK